jgi:hypothetical protein
VPRLPVDGDLLVYQTKPGVESSYVVAIVGTTERVGCSSHMRSVKLAYNLALARRVDVWVRDEGGSFELVTRFRPLPDRKRVG